MNTRKLRIATRKSPLAWWQAEHVAARLRRHHPGLDVELIGMRTEGDRVLDSPLARIGGKGLFVKELEQGMLAGDADAAVHSIKDVPMALPEGLHLPVITAREDPRDALVCQTHDDLFRLPAGSRVGTASLRRQCQLAALRPDLEILPIRGNVNTRLRRFDDGDFDALVLATAGLVRLGMAERIAARIDPAQSLPAIGQGALGIECRAEDDATNALLAPLHDADTATCVLAERAFNRRLDGGCQVPVGGYAVLQDGELWLRGLVGRTDGSEIVRDEIRGDRDDAEALGTRLGDLLLARGAGEILAELRAAAP